MGYVILTGYTSINAIVKAELFPFHIRALGVGLGYALANSIFGGTSPVIYEVSKAAGQVPLFIAYVTACIAVSLAVYIFALHNKAETPLDAEQGFAYQPCADAPRSGSPVRLEKPREQVGQRSPLGCVEMGEQRPTGRAGDVLGGAEDLPAPVGELDRAQPPVAGHGPARRERPCLEVVDDPHHRHSVAPHALDEVALGLRPVLGDDREHPEVATLDPERRQRLGESAGGPGVGAAQQLSHGVGRHLVGHARHLSSLETASHVAVPDVTIWASAESEEDPMPEPASRPAAVGRVLLVIVAAITVVAPMLLDGVVLAGAHMENPAWLPHAKLHAAIALLAAVALGGGALVCLLARPVTDAFSMAMGGYLAGAFWVALIGAGAWPDTSYYFADDPVYGKSTAQTLGVPNNVVTALVMIAAVVVGLLLVLGSRRQLSRGAPE